MKTDEEFFDIVWEYRHYLQMCYQRHADKKPVMELSLPTLRISAYPYREYMKTLSLRSQKMLRKQYREAVKENRMVVFVRDEEARVLKSAVVPFEEMDIVERDAGGVRRPRA